MIECLCGDLLLTAEDMFDHLRIQHALDDCPDAAAGVRLAHDIEWQGQRGEIRFIPEAAAREPEAVALLLADLTRSAYVIADGECFDRLMRWIRSRRDAALASQPVRSDQDFIDALTKPEPTSQPAADPNRGTDPDELDDFSGWTDEQPAAEGLDVERCSHGIMRLTRDGKGYRCVDCGVRYIARLAKPTEKQP